MIQTENTAIVLRRVNYRDYDRMVTLLSPSRGRIDAIVRNCRKPKSHNLNAAEPFSLGDYMMIEAGGHMTVTSVHLIETFYPLRNDYARLTCGMWLLSLAEAVAEPEQEQQELFMLLLHTLSRLAFSDQPWKPLLAGFLLHFSACQGFKPRLNHCVLCGKKLGEDSPVFFDVAEGGLCCANCRRTKEQVPLSAENVRWMRQALTAGSASWINTGEAEAPFAILRNYVEDKLGRRLKSAALLPEE